MTRRRRAVLFGVPTLASLLVIVAGLVWFSQVSVGGSYVSDVLPVMLLLGVGAGECWIVEDSVNGLRAAKAAGSSTISSSSAVRRTA